jgi:hypothetical protein
VRSLEQVAGVQKRDPPLAATARSMSREQALFHLHVCWTSTSSRALHYYALLHRGSPNLPPAAP